MKVNPENPESGMMSLFKYQIPEDQIRILGQKMIDLSNVWLGVVAFGGIFNADKIAHPVWFFFFAVLIYVAFLLIGLSLMTESRKEGE